MNPLENKGKRVPVRHGAANGQASYQEALEAGRVSIDINLLQEVAQGTANTLGADFFHSLVRHLAQALQVRHVLLAEVADPGMSRVRSVAKWNGSAFDEN